MIKRYNDFLFENVNMSIDMIINIIKSLKKSDDNDELVNKLINYSDKNGKTVLMSISQSNNQDLIDFILKLDVDVENKDKHGRNVLYYCKNLKTFNKFYNIVSDVNFIDKKTDKNLLSILASKNIFNVKIYKELIDKGLDINRLDSHGNTLLSYSITNYNIVKLLIDNGAKINIKNKNDNFQLRYINDLIHNYTYFKFKRKSIIKVFKLLFKNGLDFDDFIFNFFIKVINGFHDENIYIEFLKSFQIYLSEDYLIKIFNSSPNITIAKVFLGLGIYPKLYKNIKEYSDKYWPKIKNNDTLKFLDDYKKQNPYLDDVDNFNL